MYVLSATSKALPIPDADKALLADKTYSNLKVVPAEVSKQAEKALCDPSSLVKQGETPELKFEYLNGDSKGEIGELEAGSRYAFGRSDESDFQIPLQAVSRKHLQIMYDKDYGWLLEDVGSLMGTWLHAKSYVEVFTSDSNSKPVQMRDKMVIKAHSYTFRFT
jgi:pSer/pThr/pTyr-binding forkhead associated (FHA) protein